MDNLFDNLDNEINYKIILNCIKDCSISKNDLHLYYSLFNNKKFSKFHKLKTEFLFAIFRNSSLFDEVFFEKSFGEKWKLIYNLKNKTPQIAYFPIVNNNFAKISNVYLYEIDEDIDILSFPNTPVEILKALNILKTAIDKNFFVIFEDDNFTGNSFLLSIAAGFFVNKQYIKSFVFSGNVDEKGNVLPVGFLEEKEAITIQNQKFFVSNSHIKNISELEYLNSDTINIPFIQLFGKPKTELFKNFNNLSKFLTQKDKILLKIYIKNIEQLSLFESELIENSINNWNKLLKEFRGKIEKFLKLPVNANIHFLCSLSVFAFAMGVIFGAKRKIAIYHFQDGTIFKVLDFINHSPRNIKSKTNIFKYVKVVTEDENFDETGVIIYFASHNPGKVAENFIKNTIKANLVKITLKDFQGNIPAENEDIWLVIAKELYSIINNLDSIFNRPIERNHFIFSMPVPIAFALGMALGDYKNIIVYNYDKISNSYKPVLDSDKSENFKNFF